MYETSKIRNAFAPTFVSLREAIPRTIEPGAICNFKEVRQSKAQAKFQGQTYRPNKYKFPKYMDSDYDIKMKIHKKERATMRSLQNEISSEPFRPGGYRRKLKHEVSEPCRVLRLRVVPRCQMFKAKKRVKLLRPPFITT